MSAEVVYSVTDLGVLGGTTFSRASDVNDHGQVVGWSSESKAFIWDATSNIQPLGHLTGSNHRNQYARAINNNGQVAGSEVANDWKSHAFLWSAAGGWTDLGELETGKGAAAFDVNGSGQVAGYGKVFVNNYAFRYDGPGDLKQLPFVSSHNYGYGINDARITVGSTSAGQAVAWYPAGTYDVLGDLGSGAGAAAVNNHNQIVGGTSGQAGLWNSGQYGNPIGLGILQIPGAPHGTGPTSSTARDINDRGQIVGMSKNSGTGTLLQSWACLWDPDRTLHNLNDLLVDNPLGWTIRDAAAVNAHGQIAGWARRTDGGSTIDRAVLLTPATYSDVDSNVDLEIAPDEIGGVSANFQSITEHGTLFGDYGISTVQDLEDAHGPLPTTVVLSEDLQVWDIDFSGQFTGLVSLVLNYDASRVSGNQTDLTILHHDGIAWQGLSTTVDPAAHTIAFQTPSFSTFVLVAVPEPSSVAMLIGLLICLASYAWRRR